MLIAICDCTKHLDVIIVQMTVLCNVGEVEEADRVSQLAVIKHRTSVSLWRQRLQMLVIQQVSAEALTAALTESLECVREKVCYLIHTHLLCLFPCGVALNRII